MAKNHSTGDLFAPPPKPTGPPPRSPLDQAVVEFAQRYNGRQFTWPDLESAARATCPTIGFGQARRAMVALAEKGVIEIAPVGGGIVQITAVKP